MKTYLAEYQIREISSGRKAFGDMYLIDCDDENEAESIFWEKLGGEMGKLCRLAGFAGEIEVALMSLAVVASVSVSDFVIELWDNDGRLN